MSATERQWKPIHLPEVPPPAGAYSPGVRAGNLLFISGQTPRDPATGQIVGTSIEEQTQITLDNVERIVRLGGATMQQLVSVTVYLSDEDNWGRFNEAYKARMQAPYPTRAVVGAQLRGILVEISAVAYVP